MFRTLSIATVLALSIATVLAAMIALPAIAQTTTVQLSI